MTDPKTPEVLADDALDAAAGGDSNHKKWIPIQSMSTPVYKPSSGKTVPTEQLSLNYEEIKQTY
ncbi:hypothetical protein KHP62_17745 [Rhodobacteraceae bacterium NNCM2]|nr:hypothetical protein [Coraliihabitans acroporae]